MPYHLISSDVAKAATVGDVGAVRYYLERNPERVNAPSIFQSKLLHIASKAGHASVVQLLIELGADVKALDYGKHRSACQSLHSRPWVQAPGFVPGMQPPSLRLVYTFSCGPDKSSCQVGCGEQHCTGPACTAT